MNTLDPITQMETEAARNRVKSLIGDCVKRGIEIDFYKGRPKPFGPYGPGNRKIHVCLQEDYETICKALKDAIAQHDRENPVTPDKLELLTYYKNLKKGDT